MSTTNFVGRLYPTDPAAGQPTTAMDTTDGSVYLHNGVEWVPTSVCVPPFAAPLDNGRTLSVKADGSGLEWSGPSALSAQLMPVLENTLFVPPPTPNPGDAYIVAAVATGAWLGKENQIALWDGAAWQFYAPQCNDITTVTTGVNASQSYLWDCGLTQWVTVATPVIPRTINGIAFASQKIMESQTGGFITVDGNIYAWGGNNAGINGSVQDMSMRSVVPSAYRMDDTLVVYSPSFVDLVYSTQNCFFIDSAGGLWAMGKNVGFQLGHAPLPGATDLALPTQIPFFQQNGIAIKRVAVPQSGGTKIPVLAISAAVMVEVLEIR